MAEQAPTWPQLSPNLALTWASSSSSCSPPRSKVSSAPAWWPSPPNLPEKTSSARGALAPKWLQRGPQVCSCVRGLRGSRYSRCPRGSTTFECFEVPIAVRSPGPLGPFEPLRTQEPWGMCACGAWGYWVHVHRYMGVTVHSSRGGALGTFCA